MLNIKMYDIILAIVGGKVMSSLGNSTICLSFKGKEEFISVPPKYIYLDHQGFLSLRLNVGYPASSTFTTTGAPKDHCRMSKPSAPLVIRCLSVH